MPCFAWQWKLNVFGSYFNKTPLREKKSWAFSWPFMVLYKAGRYQPVHLKLPHFIRVASGLFACWKWPFFVLFESLCPLTGALWFSVTIISPSLLGLQPAPFTSDVDECETGVCAEECLNTPGSFRCFCDGRQGRKLSQDLRSCKVNYTNSRKYNTNN